MPTTLATKNRNLPNKLDDQRWQAVQRRDASADGKFVYAVRTTGVYCRPNCPARQALRKNVAFFRTPVEAKNAGFRACKRCKPDDDSATSAHAMAIQTACRTIESAPQSVPLEDLATAAQMSPSHFHRTFRSILGVTPKQYEIQVRRNKARRELNDETTVTNAIYNSGHSSASRFYEQSDQWLGMKPSVYRTGAASQKISYSIGKCSLGPLLVANTDKGICAIFLGASKASLLQQLQDTFPKAEIISNDDAAHTQLSSVIEHIDKPRSTLALPLDISGTAFQQKVWQALRKIPAGQTLTYQELAALVGHPKSARAVANACAANKLAVAIPCHRTVHSDGTQAGYRWGTELKRKLLQQEAKLRQH